MRAFQLLLASILASIGIGIGALAIAGSDSTAATNGITNGLVHAIDQAPAVQLSTGLSGTSLGSSATLVRGLRFVIAASSDDGTTALSQASAKQEGMQISLTRDGEDLLDIRDVDTTSLYIRINLSGILTLPGMTIPNTGDIGGLAPLIDGRWFLVPHKILAGLGQQARNRASAGADGVSTKNAIALAKQLHEAITKNEVVVVAPPNHGQVTTTISVAIAPIIKSVVGSLPPASRRALQQGVGTAPGGINGLSSAAGTLVVRLTSDSTTGALRQTSARLPLGNQVLTASTDVSYRPLVLNAPAGATPLPLSAIEGLIGGNAPPSGT